jgi:NAD+ kinase
MQVAIYGRQFTMQFRPFARDLLARLKANNIGVSIFEPFYKFLRTEADLDPDPESLFSTPHDLDKHSEFMFSIGGDGTMLETMTIVRDSGIPVMGINSGRLGFLASIAGCDTDIAMDALLSGRYSIEKRGMLQLVTTDKVFGDFPFALNEFTIQKKDSAMITIQAWLDDKFLNSYWADGLIISTPTGSTAYSLSVGGPLVTPDSGCFIISPIAPHNLTVRPIVIPERNLIKLKVNCRNHEFLLSMDYQSALLKTETEIVLKRSDFDISLVRLDQSDFYTTLRNKLMWGADKRN